MSAPDRAAFLAACRTVLDVAEADESLPLPTLTSSRIRFSLYGAWPVRLMAALEAALPCEFTGGTDPEHPDEYLLSGEIGGVPVQVVAFATDVAERKITGITTVETVEWVRLPAPEQNETTEETP
jgi:hypothetical protein